MSHHDPHDPTHLAAADTAIANAGRRQALALTISLGALNLPPTAVSALAATVRTAPARQLLAEYVLGLIERAELLSQFGVLLYNDICETGHDAAAQVLGLQAGRDAHGALLVPRYYPPVGVQKVPAEETGHAVARVLLQRILAEQESRAATPREGTAR